MSSRFARVRAVIAGALISGILLAASAVTALAGSVGPPFPK